jgi:hypothetical protein
MRCGWQGPRRKHGPEAKPLADKDGPVRLIVPSDSKPGRWVHAVAKITVIDPTAATTRPVK